MTGEMALMSFQADRNGPQQGHPAAQPSPRRCPKPKWLAQPDFFSILLGRVDGVDTLTGSEAKAE